MKDEAGTVFNVEIQAERRDGLPKRVRYYQSGIDRGELPKGADYANLSDSYIIFVCNFDYFHIGKAVGERVSFLKDTDVTYEDGSHVFFLNSRYTEPNASKPILEFLDLIRTNDVERVYETPLAMEARKRMQEVRSDKELEVSYMTLAQKMLDERRMGYAEGREEGIEEGLRKAVAALKGVFGAHCNCRAFPNVCGTGFGYSQPLNRRLRRGCAAAAPLFVCSPHPLP